MTHKIIHTSDYLLVVDDSEIKEGDWYFLSTRKSVHFCASVEGAQELNMERYIGTSKVIAHRPLFKAAHLYGLDVLPPLEDDVEKLAREFATKPVNPTSPIGSGRYILEEAKKFAMEKFNADEIKSKYPKGGWISIDDILSVLEVGVECGYKFGQKSKEKYKYTEEDIIDAINMSRNEPDMSGNDIIQSLSQPKNMPIGFERQLANIMGKGEPITERNSQGKIQWVGKYIYA